MGTDAPPCNGKTGSVRRDQLQRLSVPLKNVVVAVANTHVAGGGRRPLHPKESRVAVREDARPGKGHVFRFRMISKE
jgi:hypothetical protein